MPEAKEKRGVPREPVHLVAELELQGEQVGCGVSRDASGSGLLLLTHLNLEPGRKLVLKLFIPDESDARTLQATVVRCERIEARDVVWDYRVALAFEQPPADLQTIVQGLSKRSVAPKAAEA